MDDRILGFISGVSRGFPGTIDGPTANLRIATGSSIYNAPQTLALEDSIQIGSVWLGDFPVEPVPHSSFLLFDFKQNLRHWPNVAGDISRSPPLVRII